MFTAWYERRQLRRIYSPLLESLLALYLGFEWMQVKFSHCSTVFVFVCGGQRGEEREIRVVHIHGILKGIYTIKRCIMALKCPKSGGASSSWDQVVHHML
jgi:hypothetical protein